MKGKIYRLSNGEKHYYGSTTKDLKKRLSQHLYSFHDEREITSGVLFDSVEYKISIDLMEEIEYENKEDLLWLERWWIENNECVNKLIPIRTPQERIELQITDNKKCYEKLINDKERYDKRLKYINKYYHQNKDEINEKRKGKPRPNRYIEIVCECGCEISKEHIARHRKTKKHIKLMENKTENIKITITDGQQRHGQAD